MYSRERVYRALRFQNPDWQPRDLGAVPARAMFPPPQLRAVSRRVPSVSFSHASPRTDLRFSQKYHIADNVPLTMRKNHHEDY